MKTTTAPAGRTPTTRIASLKKFGRGVVVASAVALGGVTTLSAADASAAGVSHGLRHTETKVQESAVSPVNLSLGSTAAYRVRGTTIERA